MTRRFLWLALLLPVLSLSLAGQIAVCPPIMDDGFDFGPCCAPAQPQIPAFGQIQLPGTYGCIVNCAQPQQFPLRVTLDWNPLLCDLAVIDINAISPVAGGPIVRGTLFAKYARTFTEIGAAGFPVQVWRFLVNGDIFYSPNALAASPCPVPPTGVNNRPVHFFGSVDYMCDQQGTTTGGFTARFDLTHLPRCLSHAPFSTRPLPPIAGAPEISYHIMGPAFTFAPHAAPAGFAPGESQRSNRVNWAPFAYQCNMEKDLQGQVTSLARNCLCGPFSGVLPFYEEQNFQGRVTCNGVTVPFSTIPLPGITAGGMLTMTLGTYTNGTRLNVYWGLMNFQDICNTTSNPIHLVLGSGTTSQGGYRFFNTPAAGGLLRNAIDFADSLVLDTYPPSIGFGSPYVSTQVFSLSL